MVLATDADREGEAISWHVQQLLKDQFTLSFPSQPALGPTPVLPAPAQSSSGGEIAESDITEGDSDPSLIPSHSSDSEGRTGRAPARLTRVGSSAGPSSRRPLQVERVTFTEVTPSAILAALASPRPMADDLVDAYFARRALDFLIGFKLSPVLWKKLPGCRSAGRVQSVVLRFVCEREEEVTKFVPDEYWTVEAGLAILPPGLTKLPPSSSPPPSFFAHLTHLDGSSLSDAPLRGQSETEAAAAFLRDGQLAVTAVSRKPRQRNAPAPFTTASLQQEASLRLSFSPSKTMQLARRLYEGVQLGKSGAGALRGGGVVGGRGKGDKEGASDGASQTTGLITYIRTDSVNVSER